MSWRLKGENTEPPHRLHNLIHISVKHLEKHGSIVSKLITVWPVAKRLSIIPNWFLQSAVFYNKINDQRGRDTLIYCSWFMLEYLTYLKFALWLNKLTTPTQYNVIFIIINLYKNKQYFNLEIYRDTNFQQVRGQVFYLVGGGLSSVNTWGLVALIWNRSHSVTPCLQKLRQSALCKDFLQSDNVTHPEWCRCTPLCTQLTETDAWIMSDIYRTTEETQRKQPPVRTTNKLVQIEFNHQWNTSCRILMSK